MVSNPALRTALITEAEVASHCREQLAAYKVPRQVLFVSMDDLPQTASRKVHRLKLHTLFESAEQVAKLA
jgi:fatty-acyl-CoA synthase